MMASSSRPSLAPDEAPELCGSHAPVNSRVTMTRRPRLPLIEGFPTHVVRDPNGDWHAVGFQEAAERRDQGWRVVRIVDAANAKHPVQFQILARLEEVPEARGVLP